RGGFSWLAPLHAPSRPRNVSAGVFFFAIVLSRPGRTAPCFDETGFLQDLPLFGINDQGALVPSLKDTAPLQEQADGTAVLAGFNPYRCGHGCPPMKTDAPPETISG